jgi:hypothetical protein
VSRCGLCNRPLRDAGSIELGSRPGCCCRLNDEDAPTPAPVVATSVSNTHRATTSVVPRRSTSPLAVAASWTIVLLAVFVLLEYWRWVLMGVTFVTTVAVIGLLVERYQQGRATREDSAER